MNILSISSMQELVAPETVVSSDVHKGVPYVHVYNYVLAR